jgi:hypothetical protein
MTGRSRALLEERREDDVDEEVLELAAALSSRPSRRRVTRRPGAQLGAVPERIRPPVCELPALTVVKP